MDKELPEINSENINKYGKEDNLGKTADTKLVMRLHSSYSFLTYHDFAKTSTKT